MPRLLVAVALALVPLLSIPADATADPLKDYRAPAKYQETYPGDTLNLTAIACYNAMGNAEACICTVWAFADAFSRDEAKTLGPEATQDALMALYGVCEQKHPPELPIPQTRL